MSALDVFLQSCGIVSHVADQGTDVNTGVGFILRGDLSWGILTLIFVVLSMAITAFLLVYDKGYRGCYLFLFPFVPLGTLVWNLKKTWGAYRRGDSVHIRNHNVDAAATAKLSEALTEALPQACIGSHVIAQTLYVPGVGGTVETYQWVSLGISICSLALSLATNDGWEIESKCKKALVFALLLPVLTSRLAIYASMGTIVHSAMFLLPIGTEIIIFIPISCCIAWDCLDNISALIISAAFSTINIGFGIGCLYITTVPQAITITALVIAIIGAPIQIWALKKVLTGKEYD